jgi:deoxyhypusine synthase
MQLEWRLSDDPVTDAMDSDQADPEFRKSVRAKIFLGYTSNLISAGVREQIK